MKNSKCVFLILICFCIGSCTSVGSSSDSVEVSKADSMEQVANNPAEKVKDVVVQLSNANTYYLKNDTIELALAYENIKHNKSKFYLKVRSEGKMDSIDGIAELILMEEPDGRFIIPEGTFIVDENTNDEYLCDSTLVAISGRANVSFGIEVKTRKRISLVVHHSKIPALKDDFYTLYKKE